MEADDALQPAHNILTIPPEVAERIAQAAGPTDLLNLRLACKEAEARVTRTFGQRHFAYVGVLLCAVESLDRLLEITESDKLSGFVKQIGLIMAGIPDPESDEIKPIGKTSKGRSPKAHAAEMEFLRKAQSQRLEEKYKMQKSNASSKGRWHTLTVALCRLRQRGIQPVIILSDLRAPEPTKSFDSGWSPYYSQTLRAEIGVELQTSMDVIRQQSRCTFDALASSGLQIHELKSCIRGGGLPILELARHQPTLRVVSSVFAHIRRLDMSISIQKTPTVEDSNRLAQMHISLPHLENLKLGACWEVPGPNVGESFFRQRLSKLNAIELLNFEFSYGQLCKFCRLQRSLRFVDLIGCNLTLDEGVDNVALLSSVGLAIDLERRGRVEEAMVTRCRVGDEYDSNESWDEDEEDDDDEEGDSDEADF